MMKTALTVEETALIVKFLNNRLSPYFILLFGSGARGELRPESDIDLAVLCRTAIDSYALFAIGQELAGMLSREVDLIDLSKASTVMRAQIVGKGLVIYENDSLRRMTFEMAAFKDYALLNEERQPVIERFMNGG